MTHIPNEFSTSPPNPGYCCMEVSVDGDTSDYRVKINPPAAELCVLDVADDPDTPATHYRLSENGDRIIYVSIDTGVYDEDDYCVPPVLLDLLPPFPSGDWNKGHITRTEERPEAHFAWTRVADLPAITPTWHSRHVKFNQLNICSKVMPNVAEASHPELGEVIAKYARFEWEIASYQSETEVYHWLDGQNVGPDFLGHLTEGGRVIGFLLQKLNGRHAYFQDLARCEDVVGKLHSLEILHGDLNRHNFLVNEEQVVLFDFETSVRSQDVDEKTEELRGLKKELLDH
ncbi:MAG: hypothetical protein L6R42_005924 [Xanthoria sp. 1 TBL-2021]|nr:MAG: hypothetical protein L6R42_005924 [Xanthoria sp. 1 TBL-2021]